MYRDIKKRNGAKVFAGSLLTTVCCALAMLVTSCNKNFEQGPDIKYNNDSLAVSAGKSKVLYVILDGVRGTVLQTMKPVNIVKINKNAIYSFSSLNDSIATLPTNAGSWADMLTGVPLTAHKIVSEDFAGNQLAQFPTIFTRLKEVRPNMKTVSLAASTAFNTNLATDATERAVFATDAEVQTALKGKIATSDADLIVAQFHSADVAGAGGSGYNVDNVNYTNAITTLDGYLGEALAALKARPTYTDENWLVIIASNKGGADPTAPTTDATLFGEPAKNIYVAMYNPAFDAKPYSKLNTNELPYFGKAPRFQSAPNPLGYATLSNTSVGNFGNSGNYTMMFKIRVDEATDQSWPQFMGKSSSTADVASDGWQFAMAGVNYQFDYGNSSRPSVAAIRDGKWHTIAVKFYVEGSTRYLTMFLDASKQSAGGVYPLNITSKNINNPSPWRIGTGASKATNFLMRDLAVFNVAIPDNDLIYYMRREMNTANPYFANLIGWWPCNDGGGTVLKDRSGKGNDFTLYGTVPWVTHNDLSANITPSVASIVYRTVPNGVDLPFTIYNWFKVLPPASWNLTGQSFSPSYTSLSTN